MTTDKPITAIPTIYRGIELKSRMEAQCAVLLDLIGWEWEYEPYSFTLESGISFRPDFWIPAQHMLLECRGYESELGDRQIAEFAYFFNTGSDPVSIGERSVATQFAVIQPRRPQPCDCCGGEKAGCRIYDGTEAYATPYPFVIGCDTCRWSLFHNNAHFLYAAAISVRDGKVQVNCVDIEDAADFKRLCEVVKQRA